VIVGDPKQLPPTSFFAAGAAAADDEDEDARTVADEQSILDGAMTVLRPMQRLKWHYRSRHGSLIAFSNKEFYDGELVVFPSPHDRHADYGVSYTHVPEGCCRSGVNPPEAARVAAAVVEHSRTHPGRSLGVVTMNIKQAELLRLELDRLATEDAAFARWLESFEGSLEPFFVKNLENVQGDERDTIFISTVYGRNEAGQMFQRFGPINSAGGHRRLNVLFTRAKLRTAVFSSMLPTDIRVDETTAWGPRALQGFLAYAKDRSLDGAAPSGRGPDSDFERAVIGAVRGAGYEAVPQVGVVGYFIDVGVRDPGSPGRFALGVECDGATYHSSRSARDRDRLRQQVLEGLGWRIHRVWSLDWFRDPARETRRLVAAIEAAVAAG
jgi:very-short-patch-repair endonuclease